MVSQIVAKWCAGQNILLTCLLGAIKKTKLQLSEIKTAATEQELKLINKISSKKDTCTDT